MGVAIAKYTPPTNNLTPKSRCETQEVLKPYVEDILLSLAVDKASQRETEGMECSEFNRELTMSMAKDTFDCRRRSSRK